MPDCGEDYLELGRRAQAAPLSTAVCAPGREALTYSGLWNEVQGISEALRQAGVQPQEVVAVALPSGPELLTAVLAITFECACAPLDLSWTNEEYRAYLPRLGASTLVVEQGSHSPLVEIARELRMRLVHVRILYDAPAGVFEIDAMEAPAEGIKNRRLNAKLVLHTSATTGAPKLVPRSRASVLAAAEQDVRALGLSSSDRCLSLIPLSLGHGLTMAFSQLLCGGAVFCSPAFQADGFLVALESFRPTWFAAGPSVSRVVLALARQHAQTFWNLPLRFVCSLGAAPEPDLVPSLEALLGVPVLENYGLTETSGVTRNTIELRSAGSVGKSTGAEIAIVDEAGNQVPPDTEGEVVVRGPALMSGYIDDPEANQAAFLNGWFRTGDIGRIDRDGFLFIVGRRKEMIARGGKKIAPQEVDNALVLHPAIVEVAAFAIPHRTLVEDIAAAVVLRPGAKVSELELRRFAAGRLAAYKIPRHIVFVEKIPKTAVGKPKRAALAEQFLHLAKSSRTVEIDRALTRAEEELAVIWRRILAVEQIGPRDSFFDLGGDSLLAAVMLTQTAAAVKLGPGKLPEADFFDNPTLAALADMVREHETAPQAEPALQNHVLVLEQGGEQIPFFCFSTSESDPSQFRHLSQRLGPGQPFIVICPAPPVQENRLLTVEEIARQCVASIRALRKHGPYALGGHCYGGVVAFEAARQLMDEGEQVTMLALFETPTPGYPKILSTWRAYSRAMAARLSGLVRGEKRQSQPPDFWHPALMSKYRPSMFAAPIVHFIGADVHVSTRVLNDPRLGWRDFAGAGFEVRSVPGDHVSILSESRSPALGAEFEKVLRRLNAGERAQAAAGSAR
jgi:oxalate---CoA ligase